MRIAERSFGTLLDSVAMSEIPAAPRLAETYAEVEDALLSRWPETKLEPSPGPDPGLHRAARRPAGRASRSST